MTTDLDRAVRSSLGDIIATAPEPEDEPMRLLAVGSDTRMRRPYLAVAASLVVVAGFVALSAREDQSVGSPAANQEATAPTMAATTTGPAQTFSPTMDPLTDLGGPSDAVLLFTSTLGAFGEFRLYESPSTGELYLVRRGSSGSSYGSFDRATYESGQAWSLQGEAGGSLLYGLTPPSFPVTVTFGDTTVLSDENGLWFTLVPDDLPGFRITSPSGTINVDLVTSDEVSQTTVSTISE